MTGNVGITFHGNAKPLTTELQAAGAAVKQFGEQSEKFLQKGEISARQMAFALRGVPMQFTDIVTSLQAGQNPMTVFLQQGGQLKDMFGGAGIAAKAMGGYVMGLINPFSVAAAGAAVLGAAYYQGARESSAYTKAIVMSGNAMGTTSGQLKDMAQNVAASTGATVGAAAATLVQLASAGGIATDKLERITGLALAMEKQAGVAVADTVKQFSELGKDPVKASEKLSETTNFLTASVYSQIKALQDQGDAAGAASLAQTALADHKAVQNAELVRDLGVIETGWNLVTGAAKATWDAMLGIGRSESIAAKIAELQAQVAYGPGMYGTTDFGAKARAQEQLTYLLHIQASENNLAASRKKNSEQRAAQQVLEAGYDKGLSKSAQLQKALAQEAANFAKVDQGIPGNVEKYHANMAAIQARYTETVKVARTARVGLTDAEKEAIAAQKLLGKAYADGLKEIDASRNSQQKLMAASFEEVDKAQAAFDAHGKLASVIAEETLVRLENARVITAMAGEDTAVIDAQIANRRKLVDILRDGEVRDASEKAAIDMQREQKRAAEESGKYWEDALMRAFESGKGFFQSLWDTIKNTLKTQVLKVMVSATGLTGMSAAGASVAGGGGADMFGLANTASSLSNLYSAGSSIVTIGSQVAAGTMGIANALGTMAANATGTGISGLLAANGAYGTAAAGSASAAAGGVMGGLSAIPGWGWAAMGVAALVGSGMFDGGGGPKTESSYGNMAGLGNTSATGVAGTYAKGVEDAWTTLAKQLDLSTQLKVGAFTSVDSAGDAMTQFGASATVNGVGVYDRGARLGGIENVGRSEEALQAAMQEEATRLLFAALKASDLPAQYKNYLNGVADNVAAMNAAIGDVTLVSNFTTALQALPFANLKNLGFDAAKGLIEVAGGLEALGANLNTYYTLYYSEAERLAVTSDQVATALAEVNVAMPVTKDAYRALVDSLDLTTAAGRSTYAVMMTLAPEFAQVADAAAAAATESVKLMNDVFDTLQNRLTSLVDSIASERAAVAGASAGMLGLQPKTAAQLAAEIAGAKVALPSDAALLAANATLAAAAANVAAKNTAVEQARALSPSTALLDAAKSSLDSAVATIAQRQTTADWYRQDQGGRFAGYVDAGLAGFDARGIYGESEELYSVTAGFMLRAANLALPPVQASYNAALADYSAAMTVYANNVAAAQATLSTATAAQATAQATAKQALLAYAAAMTQYSGDAEKAVKVLSQLREETVAYYEAQKELAGLMTTSAANLRGAVQTSQFGQLATGAALAQQQADFARNYSLALATSGAAKAGYADSLTAALPALTSALMDTSSTRSAWALATAKLYSQSETIATQLDSVAAGMNYEAESLSLLGSIDVALGELDTNTAILKNAIDGGTATSAAGLRAILTQLGGVPAFASGGSHHGGLRMVGENGPELEVTGPSRIYNASQTRSLLQSGGGNGRLEALVQRLTQEVEGLRAEARATATATNKTAKILGRVTQDGESITTSALKA